VIADGFPPVPNGQLHQGWLVELAGYGRDDVSAARLALGGNQ
jgi:hypothetical protein